MSFGNVTAADVASLVLEEQRHDAFNRDSSDPIVKARVQLIQEHYEFFLKLAQPAINSDIASGRFLTQSEIEGVIDQTAREYICCLDKNVDRLWLRFDSLRREFGWKPKT